MLKGSCQCGAVIYEVDATPIDIYVCHCTECRKQSSSAFGISVIVPAEAMRIVEGKTRIWTRPTASGGEILCLFCETCGSRISHADPAEDVVSIKGGSLASPVDLTGVKHIWTQSKLPGITIPAGCESFEREPA
ncbi:GFA family protein [Nisaea sediminum]|uniref:GFA family protein n=1 Tax=Nisaea sediminum TaxID=2775867 RepID=UPI001867E68D|nr:GFA family protein [Nisaea sediminum]